MCFAAPATISEVKKLAIWSLAKLVIFAQPPQTITLKFVSDVIVKHPRSGIHDTYDHSNRFNNFFTRSCTWEQDKLGVVQRSVNHFIKI
jgi:hypothetical protein